MSESIEEPELLLTPWIIKCILDDYFPYIGKKDKRSVVAGELYDRFEAELAKVKQHDEQEKLDVARQTLKAVKNTIEQKPAVFPIALDAFEIRWLYDIAKQKRLDRPELRQRIIEILVKPLKLPYQEDAAEMIVQGSINQAEEILVLFDTELEVAKREERERIIAWGLEICPHWSGKQTREVGIIKRDCSLCWQALKGG